MKKIMLILLLVITFTVSIESSQGALFVTPDLSFEKVGFELSYDEMNQYYEQMKKLFLNDLNVDVEVIDDINLNRNKIAGRDIYFFSFNNYYLTYHSMGTRESNFEAILLKYSSNNNYSSPIQTSIVEGHSNGRTWGRGTPLEMAIEKAFLLFKSSVYQNTNKISLNLPVEEIIRDGIHLPSDVALVKPYLGCEVMTFSASDEEKSDLTRHIAHLCKDVVGERVCLIDRSEVNDESNKFKKIITINFMYNESKIKFKVLDKSKDKVIYIFNDYVRLNEDLNENDELRRSNIRVFKKIRRDYKKNVSL